jgi:hypothetical protein
MHTKERPKKPGLAMNKREGNCARPLTQVRVVNILSLQLL